MVATNVGDGEALDTVDGEIELVGVEDDAATNVPDTDCVCEPDGEEVGVGESVGVCVPVEDLLGDAPADGVAVGEQLGATASPRAVQRLGQGHARHVEFVTAPVLLLYVPMGQSVHSRYSATVENDPVGHAAHVEEGESFVMYCPGAQANGNIARSLLFSVSET